MRTTLQIAESYSPAPAAPPAASEVVQASRGKRRVESLDYLRGVLAIGVMLYHYKMWTGLNGPYPIQQIFSRIGIYAVCTFYVLSGMSLGIVYGKRQIDGNFLLEFAVKRFFRIVPLFWLVTTLTIVIRWFLPSLLGTVSSGVPRHGFLLAVLNYSLLFGWVRPDLYIAGGAWSIGNELVFYSLFPGLLLLMRASRLYLTITLVALFAIGMWFAFGLINGSGDLDGQQWDTYVNPMNHAFLFAAGIAIILFFGNHPKISLKWLYFSSILCIAAFVFWPLSARGETGLVTGYERPLFSAFCCAFCYLALIWKVRDGKFTATLVWIGNISYAVYLLHPILFYVFDILNTKLFHANAQLISFGLAMPVTIISAMLSWRLLERPATRLGRTLLLRSASQS